MKYIIVIDKQSRSNPSGEAREYAFEIDELLRKGDIADDLIVEQGKAKYIKRIELTKYGVTNVLSKEVVTELGDCILKLFEGDNYIYVKDQYNNILKAEYVIKNQFTDLYVTDLQMKSAIEESADKITLSVEKVLTGYATTEETKAMIKLLSDEINLEVSKKLNSEDLTSAYIIMRINEDVSEIKIKADKIDILGKKVKFKTQISSTYSFTNQDLENIRNYIMGTYELTNSQKELYDINKDGKVNAVDYMKIKNLMNANGKVTIEGSIEIDPDSASRSLILKDSSGNIITSIGLLGMQTESFNTANLEANKATIQDLIVTNSFTCEKIEDLIKRVDRLEAQKNG